VTVPPVARVVARNQASAPTKSKLSRRSHLERDAIGGRDPLRSAGADSSPRPGSTVDAGRTARNPRRRTTVHAVAVAARGASSIARTAPSARAVLVCTVLCSISRYTPYPATNQGDVRNAVHRTDTDS